MEVFICCFHIQKLIKNTFFIFLYALLAIGLKVNYLTAQILFGKYEAKVRAFLRHFPESLKTMYLFDSILYSDAYVLSRTWVSNSGNKSKIIEWFNLTYFLAKNKFYAKNDSINYKSG